ncbi:hypothetical protein Ancab_019063 [Ancistrocladus abbreviatus]
MVRFVWSWRALLINPTTFAGKDDSGLEDAVASLFDLLHNFTLRGSFRIRVAITWMKLFWEILETEEHDILKELPDNYGTPGMTDSCLKMILMSP